MHNLYFVLKQQDKKLKTSSDVRSFVYDELIENGFASSSQFFSTGKADWFVIGGRWSVLLNEKYDEFMKKARKLIKEKGGDKDFISMKDVEVNKKELQKIWEELGNKSINPLNRNTYESIGYDDDAVILTKEIIKAIKPNIDNDNYDNVGIWDYDEFEEIITNDLSDKDIGKWLVVIDYHN